MNKINQNEKQMSAYRCNLCLETRKTETILLNDSINTHLVSRHEVDLNVITGELTKELVRSLYTLVGLALREVLEE